MLPKWVMVMVEIMVMVEYVIFMLKIQGGKPRVQRKHKENAGNFIFIRV